MRKKAEIVKALDELHKGIAEYLLIFGADADSKILAGIDSTLHWVLGEDNTFGKLLGQLKAISKAQAEAVSEMVAKGGQEHDASRSN